jgi:hypothetical protein
MADDPAVDTLSVWPPSDRIRVYLALGADLVVVLNDIPYLPTILACLNNE